ncbi:MAG: c-type cytochrome [Candidatus Aminicenantes bacterium]|nr:c-type cytochrome [Candidatus Aminicenantes bacterium]
MNYPVWYIPAVGGSMVIAVMAIVHVVVSHFAVGGGLWLVLTEKKAYREKKEFIVDYVKKHAKFFMLLTMVFGAMTGVGIWFTIALINPSGTSALIHSFVFAWAIEWVFFVIEIVAAFLYFYTFKKISEKTHLFIAWVYFIAAWASLFIINAILAFMMTPGKWLQTQNFWDGMFNPTFWPSLVFRTFLCFALAGSYALLTAAKKLKGEEKKSMVRYNGKWILLSLAGMIPSLLWYYFSLPETAQQGIGGASSIMYKSLIHLVISLGLFLLLLFLFILWKAQKLNFTWSIVTLLAIFVFFGAFEFIREAGRKPFIIADYMYVSGLTKTQHEELQDRSVLAYAKWVQTKEVKAGNELQAGEEIFRIECSACHTGGIKNNIYGVLKDWDQKKIIRSIGALPGITGFMPGFVGTNVERAALGKWLYAVSHKGVPAGETQPAPESAPAPAFPGEKVFEDYCAACHEIDGDNAVRPKLKNYENIEKILDMLGKLDELNEDMPAFEGSDAEKKALAQYLLELTRREK